MLNQSVRPILVRLRSMKRVLFHLVLFTASSLFAAETVWSGPDYEIRVYGWLQSQQGTCGLLANEEGDSLSGLYTNALAALCFLHHGDVERAERIFQCMRLHSAECLQAPGGFYQFWSAANGEPHRDTDRWIGDNAWFLIALNYYKAKTGKTDYDDMREGIARWLISLQDKDGGVWGGYVADGHIEYKSTEGNLDCYAALVEYPKERAKIKRWLIHDMWIPKERRLRMGSTVDESALDDLTWGVAALGPRYHFTLKYAEEAFLQTVHFDQRQHEVTGFSDFLFKNHVWLEGTGQVAAAYQYVGNKEKTAHYLAELERSMIPSQAFEGTYGMPCFTNNPRWSTGASRIFVPSQAWYLFAKWGFNPMDASLYPSAAKLAETQAQAVCGSGNGSSIASGSTLCSAVPAIEGRSR